MIYPGTRTSVQRQSVSNISYLQRELGRDKKIINRQSGGSEAEVDLAIVSRLLILVASGFPWNSFWRVSCSSFSNCPLVQSDSPANICLCVQTSKPCLCVQTSKTCVCVYRHQRHMFVCTGNQRHVCVYRHQ